MAEQTIKIRKCSVKDACPYKNTWWDATQCLAQFHIWYTCFRKGLEQKIQKKERKDG